MNIMEIAFMMILKRFVDSELINFGALTQCIKYVVASQNGFVETLIKTKSSESYQSFMKKNIRRFNVT